MRRFGLYDATRGLTIALAAALAGLLLYLATQVGMQSTARFWESLGIVAAAGLALALAPVLGGWTTGLRLRFSPGTFVLGFLPVLVCVGWTLMATQPGNGWHEGTIVSWSTNVGLMDVIHDLGLWHGVLAFALGLTLGMTFDTVPVAEPEKVVFRQRPTVTTPKDTDIADEPLAAEREAAAKAEPHTVTVGTAADRDEVPERMD